MTAAFLIVTAALTTGAPRPQAQAPVPTPPTPATAPRSAPDRPDDRLPAAAAAPVTVEGCVAAENDVPGRAANAAEQVGIRQDFILTSAKVVKGTAPAAAAANPSDGVISRALQPMFEIGGLRAEQLQSHVGRRVRIVGTFENTGPRDPDASRNDELVELNGSTIVQIPGACPALPRKSE
jgi:hypothetical protein